MKIRKNLLTVLMAGMLAVGAAACGGDDAGGEAEPGATDAGAGATEVAPEGGAGTEMGTETEM